MAQSVKSIIANALKSYRNGSAKITYALGVAAQFAKDHDHNPVHLLAILDGLDPQDVEYAVTIIGHIGAHKVSVKEGAATIKVKKDKEQRIYNEALIARMLEGKISFRTLAGELEPAVAVKKPEFDLDAFTARFLKRALKEGAELKAIQKALNDAAHKALEAKANA